MSPLADAEKELEQLEAELWKSIGLSPDGDIADYLTEANFHTSHRLSSLREKVSMLMATQPAQ